jgi:hypothetical protein
VSDLNKENKDLILQLEELKKVEKDKLDSIDNMSKNLNCMLFFMCSERKGVKDIQRHSCDAQERK